ncbi:hypothetical protein BC941DRAFT_426279 [Chlamydoabsidia padenii]|nr:hypothetical protein BC941DRAFT_426279 [Chlamydoabsidia padenii]
MMRAAAQNPSPSTAIQQQDTLNCFRCPSLTSSCSCTFCEYSICQQCIQQCQGCNSFYCTACSVKDYSTDDEKVYCLSCWTS